MAVGYDEEGNPNDYANIPLKLCGISTGELSKLIYKFRVMDGGTLLRNARTQETDNGYRRYDIAGVQLWETGKDYAVDYGVGGTYKFTGYAKGYGTDGNAESNLLCTVEELETVELDVKHTFYRTQTSSKGAHYQNQLDTVYFAVPKRFFDTYGTLQRIKAEWYEYKTKDIVVTSNQDFYDKYDRSKKTRVYLGEYATHIPGRKANIETALTEALYLASLERNGDVVHMTSYAPLLAKERHTQWNPDLIYFNNREVKPTTGYYVQKLYGQNAGNEYLPSKIVLDNKDDKVRKRFASSFVRDSVSGDVIVKLVNLLPVEVNTNVDLSGIGAVQPSAKRTVLTGKPTDTPLPVEDRIQIAEKFDCNLPAYSFTVIRIQKAN